MEAAAGLLRRLVRSLAIWPSLKEWLESAAILLLSVLAIALIAEFGGLIRWQPRPLAWDLGLSVFFVPAFVEEAVFRGLLVPARGETSRPVLWIAASVAVFVLWHAFEALTFLTGAHVFLSPVFLACAGMLGLGCAIVRYRTGSLWPCVLGHGLLVWFWHTWFGGPLLADLVRDIVP